MGKSTINPAVVGKHSTDIAALKNDLGIVEDGDTATHTIAQGQYVIWQGALYTADAAIASGTTLAASGGNKNLTAVANGGLNALNSKIDQVYTESLANGKIMLYKNNKVVNVFIHGEFTASQWGVLAIIPSGYLPKKELPLNPLGDVSLNIILQTSGHILTSKALNSQKIDLNVTYITN